MVNLFFGGDGFITFALLYKQNFSQLIRALYSSQTLNKQTKLSNSGRVFGLLNDNISVN